MASDVERLIREKLDAGSLPGHELSFLRQELVRFEEQRLAPEFLEAEWERQVNIYLDREFHKYPSVKISSGKFKDSMPRFSPQPETYRGRLDLPLLVVTSIPWQEEAQLADIAVSDYLKSMASETQPFNEQSQTPNNPYTGWFNSWGQRFTKKIAPFEARKELAADEIGAGPHEGIAIQLTHPEFTKNEKYFDLIGFAVESGHVLYLDDWRGRPGLDAPWGDYAHDRFRPLVRGSEIVTL